MNPKYRYQVLLFGDKLDLFRSIQKQFVKKAEELKFDLDAFIFITNEEAFRYKGNQPAYCIFANSSLDIDENIARHITRQKNEGNTILPIYENDFTSEINGLLADFNGINISEGIESVVNHILEGFDLLRRRRKLFVSYRRSDARAIAIKIFDWFESLNYEVFLDTHSVPKGALFQKHLWHQMSDSDIVILLDSKDFLNSEWCEKELTFAENKRIAILRVKFPDSSIPDDNMAVISTIALNSETFNGESLDDDELSSISKEVESLRARALASRQDHIITELIDIARLNKHEVVRFDQNLLRLKITRAGTEEEYLFVPAIGVPQSLDFQNIDFKLRDEISKAKDIYLIYDDSSLLKSWNEHMTWLNGQLKIHSLNRTHFNEFFQNL